MSEIRRVTRLDLSLDDAPWPFAVARRSAIDDHFALLRLTKPELWNGRILLARQPRFDGETFSARCFEADFASLLAWRDWGYPDAGIVNIFGMGALRCNDGAFVLGEMGRHTANAGRVYFPSGTPDRSDIREGRVDIAASVGREVAEETGLTAADYDARPAWHCVASGALVALIRRLDVDMPGEALCARIESHLAGQRQPELTAVRLVRSMSDITTAMPAFIGAYIAAQLDEQF